MYVPSRRSADNHLAFWIKARNQWQWQIGDLVAQHVVVSLISAACYTAHHAKCILYCNVDFSMIVSWLLLSSIRTYRFPTSHIICLLSFHSTHFVALRSVDGIARSADFLSLPPSLHVLVHEHIKFTLDKATSMYATGRPRRHSLSTRTGKPVFTQKIGAFATLNIAQDFCA